MENRLDARLGAIAEMALRLTAECEAPCAADIGCDHGYLAAHLLAHCPALTMIASDVSAPSLEKAKQLLRVQAQAGRVKLAVADGLAAIDRPVDVIVIAGMGAQTILKIVREGIERIGDAQLIVQANVDLPLLRTGLTEMGFVLREEAYLQALGRQYVTLCAVRGAARPLNEREALLGAAACGVQNDAQRQYYLWQRGVRIRELQQMSLHAGGKTAERMRKCARELGYIQEALAMKNCSAADIENVVGSIAPYELAEEWDNVGLLLGSRRAQVTRVLVALDLTEAVVAEAEAIGAQAIVTHHPIMFSARRRITDDDREGRLMLRMIRSGIAHIAAHTNLDAAPGGVNDVLLRTLGAQNIRGEGFIRIGEVEPGMTLEALAARAQRSLKAAVRVYGAADTQIFRLGCCSGAGSGEIAQAAALGADCFITGEVKHNLALDAMDMGCCVIEAGHYETENPVCEVLAEALQNAADELKYNVTVFCSKGNPFGR